MMVFEDVSCVMARGWLAVLIGRVWHSSLVCLWVLHRTVSWWWSNYLSVPSVVIIAFVCMAFYRGQCWTVGRTFWHRFYANCCPYTLFLSLSGYCLYFEQTVILKFSYVLIIPVIYHCRSSVIWKIIFLTNRKKQSIWETFKVFEDGCLLGCSTVVW
jgi:hypothetical protein